jgi:hypothetical protein
MRLLGPTPPASQAERDRCNAPGSDRAGGAGRRCCEHGPQPDRRAGEAARHHALGRNRAVGAGRPGAERRCEAALSASVAFRTRRRARRSRTAPYARLRPRGRRRSAGAGLRCCDRWGPHAVPRARRSRLAQRARPRSRGRRNRPGGGDAASAATQARRGAPGKRSRCHELSSGRVTPTRAGRRDALGRDRGRRQAAVR